MTKKRVRAERHLPPPPPPVKGISRREIGVLLIILILATLLRFHYIDHESLWLDEGVSLYLARTASFQQLLFFEKHERGHPPFFDILLKLWIHFFGDSPHTARLFVMSTGIATLPLLFFLTRRLFDSRTAMLATLLLAVSAYHIYFSQELRMYTLLGLEALLSILLFEQFIDEKSNLSLILFTVVNIAGLYTNYFYIYVLLAHAVSVARMFVLKKRSYSLLLSLSGSGLAFFPWVFRVMLVEWHRRLMDPLATLRVGTIIVHVADFLGVPLKKVGYTSAGFNITLFTYVTVTLVSLILITYVLIHWEDPKCRTIVFYLAMPYVGFAILQLLLGPMVPFSIPSRYFILSLGPFFILISKVVQHIPRVVGVSFIVLLIATQLMSAYFQSRVLSKEDWRGAAVHLTAHFPPGTHVVIAPNYVFEPISAYMPDDWPQTYAEGTKTNFTFIYNRSSYPLNESPQELVYITSSVHMNWNDANESLTAYLRANYTMLQEKNLTAGVQLIYYLRKNTTHDSEVSP